MVKNNTKKRVKNFKEAFYSLPASETRNAKEHIKKIMGWGNDLFYKKLRGDRQLKGCEQLVLKAIFSKYNIEL